MQTIEDQVEEIKNADIAMLRGMLGEKDGRTLRSLTAEFGIKGLSRGTKKACVKALFQAETERRSVEGTPEPVSNTPLEGQEAPQEATKPVETAPKPSKPKKAAKKGSKKAPKTKRVAPKPAKAPKPEESRAALTTLGIEDLAESAAEAVADLAEVRGITASKALDLLVQVGRSRLRATDKYYRAQVEAKAKKSRKKK